VRAIRDVIGQVLSDDLMRKEMRETGLTRARQFMWDNAAKDAVTIFDQLVNG